MKLEYLSNHEYHDKMFGLWPQQSYQFDAFEMPVTFTDKDIERYIEDHKEEIEALPLGSFFFSANNSNTVDLLDDPDSIVHLTYERRTEVLTNREYCEVQAFITNSPLI